MGIADNRTLLQKADLALSDLASGGILGPAQSDRFIRLAIKNAAFMRTITVKSMAAFQEHIETTRFSSRVLKPGTEATALPLAYRSKPTMGRRTLDAKLFKAEVRMSEEVLEDQIEREAFQNTVMQMLSEAIARDMDTVIINGDTHSANTLLAVLDGALHQATSNTVNGSSARLNKGMLRDALKALDDEYASDPSLKYWTNRQAKIDYRDTLADRATELGDAALQTGGAGLNYNDIPINVVPEFPPTTETGGSNTQVLLTSPANVVVGIHRNIRIQTQLDAPAGVLIIVASLRFDVKVVELSAAARVYDVLGT